MFTKLRKNAAYFENGLIIILLFAIIHRFSAASNRHKADKAYEAYKAYIAQH